ncbi:MAG: carbon-nitrogen family hydrolase, partial [Veillonella sp.]|nr:carbon-nitrogen family hydrolase [Veillonella sp.]MDU2575980.1 carbon-nitrogen family hydrolase [Veillonella sp.]
EMDTNEGIASVDIDLTVVEDIRKKINIFRDRKPELYNL